MLSGKRQQVSDRHAEGPSLFRGRLATEGACIRDEPAAHPADPHAKDPFLVGSLERPAAGLNAVALPLAERVAVPILPPKRAQFVEALAVDRDALGLGELGRTGRGSGPSHARVPPSESEETGKPSQSYKCASAGGPGGRGSSGLTLKNICLRCLSIFRSKE